MSALTESIRKILDDVVPGAGADEIAASVDLREELELDSMDFLNFVIALDKELGVKVPQADYALLTSLDACAGYVERVRSSSA